VLEVTSLFCINTSVFFPLSTQRGKEVKESERHNFYKFPHVYLQCFFSLLSGKQKKGAVTK